MFDRSWASWAYSYQLSCKKSEENGEKEEGCHDKKEEAARSEGAMNRIPAFIDCRFLLGVCQKCRTVFGDIHRINLCLILGL